MKCKVHASFLVCAARADQEPTCLDDDGKPVDWFVLYKMPVQSSSDPSYGSGYTYAYITSEDVKNNDPARSKTPETPDEKAAKWLDTYRDLLLKYINHFQMSRRRPITRTGKSPKSSAKVTDENDNLKWTLSKKLITDQDSMILRTLEIAYNKKKGSHLNSIFYNDAPPGADDDNGPKQNSLRAHAKGVLVMDEGTGNSIWVTHSTPLFPPPRDMDLKFNENSRTKGQTFMCVNFDLNKSGEQVVDHLVNMFPLVYDAYVSDTLIERFPNVDKILPSSKTKQKRKKITQPKLSQMMATRGGMDLFIYSKSGYFREDMYSDWLNDDLGTKLYVETWRNGAGTKLNSSCPKDDYHVNNVLELKLDTGKTKFNWNYRVDHSKWAISDTRDLGVVCISDVNRMESQFKRGGGAVCFKCPSCWSVFDRLILETEPCPVQHKAKDI